MIKIQDSKEWFWSQAHLGGFPLDLIHPHVCSLCFQISKLWGAKHGRVLGNKGELAP